MATTIVVRISLTERDYELINRLMPTIVRGWQKADDLTLAHEAERLEGLQSSPVTRSMRQIVDTIRTERAHGGEGGN